MKWKRKLGYMKLTKALILDACATTAVEEVCDAVENVVKENAAANGCSITFRYSPGYGDLPLEVQNSFLRALDAQKKIGLTVSENNLLFPRKSVTAIIGIFEGEIEKKKRTCKECNNYGNCNFRREDESCGLKEIIKDNILIFDGAMGTMIQRKGVKLDENPEVLNIKEPHIIEEIHKEYIESRANAITANTFGANELKLKLCNLEVEEAVDAAVKIEKRAKGNSNTYVALDIGPIGELLEPMGTDRAYEIFKRQIVL